MLERIREVCNNAATFKQAVEYPVYFEKKGRLYFDGNDSEKNWGNSDEGGLVAILKGKPELTVEDITLLAI